MKLFALITSAFLLSACGGGGGHSNSAPPAQPTFVDETIRLAGPDANDCGELSIGEAPSDINRCVADAFLAYQSFHAIYNRQGIDSNVATGFAYNSMELYLLEFDDFSCGAQGDCETDYRVFECVAPAVNDLESEQAAIGNPFDCSDLIEVTEG